MKEPNWIDNFALRWFWKRWSKIFPENTQVFLILKRDLDAVGVKFYPSRTLVLGKDVDQYTVFCAEQCEEPMQKFLFVHSTKYLSNLPLKDMIIDDIVQLRGWETNPDYDETTTELLEKLHKYRQLGLV
jgi:hypothetical protein